MKIELNRKRDGTLIIQQVSEAACFERFVCAMTTLAEGNIPPCCTLYQLIAYQNVEKLQ